MFQKNNCELGVGLTWRALSEKEIGAVPGGAATTFWLPVYMISISHSSIFSGTPPQAATESV